jgi:hypothetical protein
MSGRASSWQAMVRVENFHRSARAPPAARRHARHIGIDYDTAGHTPTSRLCRVPGYPGTPLVALDGGGKVTLSGGGARRILYLDTCDPRLVGNRCDPTGPDLGGAAIRALSQYQGRPVYVVNSTFRGGVCSNGGALSSIVVSWVVLNSVMTRNRAIGWGANPARSGTPGGGAARPSTPTGTPTP